LKEASQVRGANHANLADFDEGTAVEQIDIGKAILVNLDSLLKIRVFEKSPSQLFENFCDLILPAANAPQRF
jgi:hypothetical protein